MYATVIMQLLLITLYHIALHCFTFCVIQPLWRVTWPFWNIIVPFRGPKKVSTHIIAPLGVLKQFIDSL